MLQQNSHFYFSQPMTFYGSFEQIENSEIEEEVALLNQILPFSLDVNPKHPTQQNIGIYLQWYNPIYEK